jgi:hypothetical protein
VLSNNATFTGTVGTGTVTSSGSISAAGNIASGGTATFIGNTTGGNLSTPGLITATGNITGANIVAIGFLSATGNINTLATVTGGNLISTSTITASGNIVTNGNITGGNINANVLGFSIGYRDLPLAGAFGTLSATDGGKQYYGSGTLTIPANASVGLNDGTSILIIATGSTTVAPAGGVTLILAGSGATGSRTLGANAMATIVKVATNTWYISGTGIS